MMITNSINCKNNEKFNTSQMAQSFEPLNGYEDDSINKRFCELMESFYKGQLELKTDDQYDCTSGVVRLNEKKSLKDRYWAIMRNEIQVSYSMTKKAIKKSARLKTEKLYFGMQKYRKKRKPANPDTDRNVEQRTKTKAKSDAELNQKNISLDAKLNAYSNDKKGLTPDLKLKAKSKTKRKRPMLRFIKKIFLSENDWFYAKYEREVGWPKRKPKKLNIAKVQKSFKRRVMMKRFEIENYIYANYREKPRPDNIPDVTWTGPKIKLCGCVPKDCTCKGDILLSSKLIPITIRYTWNPVHYLRILTCFKRFKREPPKKTFAQRLSENVQAEEFVYKKLDDLGILQHRSAEFCPYRCFYYHFPLAKKSASPFHLLKSELSKPVQPKAESKPEPVPMETVEVAETFEEDQSNDKSTQFPKIDENGDFILDDDEEIQSIKFGSLPYWRHVEGQRLLVEAYSEPSVEERESIGIRLKKMLRAQGIRNRFSKITCNFSNIMTSILQIEDPGIPIYEKETQDPPLDDDYESIIYIIDKSKWKGKCPCCYLYKKYSSPVDENNTLNEYFDEYADHENIAHDRKMKRFCRNYLQSL